ncbi:MAG: RluA family pseudouridine synthase [Anaeroplasmataceae bacterium]|nr:RluA family pseudouridine synthase [Anaeroplasmataceae bacterium]
MTTSYKITSHSATKTLKEYLESYHLGKNKISSLFSSKAIFINGKLGTPNSILKLGDIVTIDIEEEIDFLPDVKKLDILYEDDYLLVLNKPSHILVHPDDKAKRGTLCNIVAYYYKNKGYSYQVRYAHRLDMDTTGVLLFAKDSLTLAKLDEMISTHELKRTYLCLALGKFKNKKGTIDAPIGEDRHHQQRKRISKTGKTAVTHYEVLKEFKKFSLVQVQLETGRTHQIRVHLASIGHPLLGDELYGAPDLQVPRVMLHSYEAQFIHPVTHEEMRITKDIPYDMKQLIKR